MFKSERNLPIAIAIFAPAFNVLNGLLLVDEIAFDLVLINYLQGVGIVLILWYLNKWLLRKTKDVQDPKLKYGLIALINVLLVVLVSFLGTTPLVEEVLGEYTLVFLASRLMILAFIFNVILRVFDEQKKMSGLQVQNLSLKAENLKFQVDLLKQQINPHFLFNSLNTLLDLVEEKSDKSADFVRSFSTLYRAVLQSSKHDLIPLKDELKLLEDYWYLLEIRFEKSIDLKREIDDAVLDALIPPLSLQFLVENAVKHNQATENEPLLITIKQYENGLLISNKLKPKTYPVQSEKVGLLNLEKRFSALNKEIKYWEEDNQFKVLLTLN